MNQEESEHNEVDGMKKGVDSKGEVMHVLRPSSVVCRRMYEIIIIIIICFNKRLSYAT